MYRIEVQKFIKTLADEIEKMSEEQFKASAVAVVSDLISRFPRSFFNLFIGGKLKRLREHIVTETAFLDSYFSPNMSTRCYYFTKGLHDIIRCETCGKPYLKQVSPINTVEFFHCNAFCAQQNPKVLARIDETKTENGTHTKDLLERTKMKNREKYGVDWYMQTKEFTEKKELKCVEKYGTKHHMQSDSVKTMMADRYEAKHGVRSPFQDPVVKEKSRMTCRKNLGCDYPSQNAELCKKKNQTSADSYKRNFYRNTIANYKNIEPMFSEDFYAQCRHNSEKKDVMFEFEWRCRKCGNMFKQRMFKYGGSYGNEPRCLKCDPLIYQKDESKFEKSVREEVSFFARQRFDVVFRSTDNRTLITSDSGDERELDILLRDKVSSKYVFAIECNGIYYHDINHKPTGYHLEKTIACEKLGIRLIHIWEDDWLNDYDRTSTFLKNVILGNAISYSDYEHDGKLYLPRDKFNKVWMPDGWEFDSEIAPSAVQRRETVGKQPLSVEDCGILVYIRKSDSI